MSTMSRPHAGSLAFYPRKRASKETPSFSTFPKVEVKEGEKSKPLNFLAYKAGMTHALGKDMHEKSSTAGHEIAIATTVLEAPAMKVFGIRAYGKAPKGFYGSDPMMDVLAGNVDKNLLKKIHSFKKKGKGKGKAAKKDEKSTNEKGKEEKPETKEKKNDFEDLKKAGEKVLNVRLLCHTKPAKSGVGKKKPDICEIALSGNIEQQLAFAKEKLGHEIAITDVFTGEHFVDIRAVTKGKGMQGPVKRAGVKMQRPKAKKRRIVGSISPWNPSTVMWQVPRPGQMGYHSRTEYNKKVLKIGSAAKVKEINQVTGFKNYGLLKSDFVILAGSVAGPCKRAIGLRIPIRESPMERHQVESLEYIAGTASGTEDFVEEEVKAEHVVEKKEEKVEKKSVADEITAAASGDQKREKSKQK